MTSTRMPRTLGSERTARVQTWLSPRWWLARLDGRRLVVIASAVLAGVLNLLLLTAAGDEVLVAVARVPIDPGVSIDPDVHLEFRPVDADDEFLARLVTDPDQVRRAVVVHPIDEGAPILPELLLSPGEDPGLRTLSIPVDRDRAAGGRLGRGDLVDVVAVEDGVSRVVAQTIPVLATSGTSSAFGRYHVVVTVPRALVVDLAAAIEGAEVMIVRAGG